MARGALVELAQLLGAASHSKFTTKAWTQIMIYEITQGSSSQ